MDRWSHQSGPARGTDETSEEPERLSPRHGSPVDLYRVAQAIWAGKVWLLGAGLVGLLLAAIVMKAMPPSFVATTVLKFDGVPEIPGMPNPGTLQIGSLAEAIRTEEVLGTLKERLDLDEPLPVLSSSVETVLDAQNGIVRVAVTHAEAAGAARRANGLAEIFMETLKSRARKRVEGEITRARQRLEHAQGDLAEARGAYDAFREQHGISDIDADLGQSITSAAQFRAQRDMAEADIGALEARIAQLRRDLRATPRMQVASTATQTPEAEQLARLQTELTTARSSLSPSHPRVQSLERQIAALRLRINSGQASTIATATMGASSQYTLLESSLATAVADLQARRQALADLQALAGRDSERVEQIAGLEGEATTLLARVNVNQTLVNDLENTLVRLEDALRDPPSVFSVVAPAAVPTAAQPNKKEKLAAVAVPLFILGITALVLLFREFRGMRVCTASELAFWGRGPVIATTVWPRDLHAVDDLIADMDDFAPNALGRTLVIGASRDQSVLAHTVASRLNDDWNEAVSVVDFDSVSSNVASSAHVSAAVGVSAVHGGAGPYSDVPLSESLALVPVSARSTALARHRVPRRAVESWDGPDEGPSLRRAARLADRVAVIVSAGALSAIDVAAITTRIGRTDGIGFILVDLEPAYARLKDRVGNVADFWAARRS